ncbi:MAG: ribonuclease HI family protein [Candidatus Krumholzibacteria bacterium]|jgi:ribonuclease HI|nr:ribonuclease HI family protein [Candidatus Krumholzibacteria bacterium]MDP6669798.1 ribonuclease HI family protein [Candidatus Krumholzibacteria bacterium]MDP6796207.1 ribonuclease HI family protein [Candidatus Krumholzibacteria bacterium]MDP7022553.1 ribonuclease HI family protein [Candidatus Krumholzibacteria bacterium]
MKPDSLKKLVNFLRSKSSGKRFREESGLLAEECIELAESLESFLPAAAPASVKAGGNYRVFCDGASRGNPGQAALGYLILDGEEEVFGEGLALGKLTNNQAEYRSLIAAIERVLELGISRVDIFMDSELVVRQVEGRYKVKNEGLRPLHQHLTGLLPKLGHWTLSHVPRKENSRADALANQALDSL